MTKTLQVYQAIVSQAVDNICPLSQEDLLKIVGLRSRRQLFRTIMELQALGLIVIQRYHDHHRGQTKNRYLVVPMGQIESHRPNTDGTNRVPSVLEKTTDGTNRVPSVGVMGLQESHKSAMNHDMNDKNKILSELDFINAKNRTLCAGLVDLETARRWRDLWDYCEANDAWGEYGVTSNGVGYIVRLIKNGDPVPDKIQPPLPATSLDMSELFMSRGLDKERITENHPMAQTGAVLGEDGIWR